MKKSWISMVRRFILGRFWKLVPRQRVVKGKHLKVENLEDRVTPVAPATITGSITYRDADNVVYTQALDPIVVNNVAVTDNLGDLSIAGAPVASQFGSDAVKSNQVLSLTLNTNDAGVTFDLSQVMVANFGTLEPLSISINSTAGGTLQGSNDSISSYVITGTDTGTYSDGSITVSFTDINNLTGGTGADIFTFDTGASLTGTLDGGAGADSIQVDDGGHTITMSGPNSGTISVHLEAPGFTNIEALHGGGDAQSSHAGSSKPAYSWMAPQMC